MLRTRVIPCSVALLVISLFPVTQLRADEHAEEVFRQCQEQLEQLTLRCVRVNHEVAEDCIRRIRELLHEGEVEQAIHVARHCISRIEEQTLACLHDMSHLCHRCVRVLRELEAPRLARRFEENCHVAAGTVIHSARRSIRAIENQFDGR